MAILQVKELIKKYGKGDTAVTALGGVNFSVDKGQFVALQAARVITIRDGQILKDEVARQ